MRPVTARDAGVERIGDTVRRPPGANDDLVRRLLAHFERVGFQGAPRYIGVDADGRQVFSWVHGEAGDVPAPADDEVVAAVGTLMRRMHDAQSGFDVPGGEVVCHNDWWPGNLIFREGIPVALIDWGLAAPSERIQDLARAAAWWTPLRPDDAARGRGLDPARRGPRLRTLCDSYGLDAELRARILDAAVAEQLAWANNPPDAAAGEAMRRNAAWIEEHRSDLEPWLR